MLIRGTKKLAKKTLDLASIKQQIKCGQTLPISDDHFSNSDIQIAVNMGLLESVTNKKHQHQHLSRDPDANIKCQNMMDRPLALPFRRDDEGKPLFQKEILAKGTFSITAKHMNVPEIQAAISKGLIRVITKSYVHEDINDYDDGDYTETTVKLKDMIGKNQNKLQEKLVESAQQRLDTNEEIGALSKEVEEIVWNPDTNKTVKGKTLADTAIRTSDTSKSQPAKEMIRGVPPTRFVDSETPIKVDPNADDPRVNPATVMNPSGRPVATKTGVYDPAVINAPAGDAPKTSPLSKKEAAMITNDEEVDILFVDQEEEAKRRAQHPVLKDKPLTQEDADLDFV